MVIKSENYPLVSIITPIYNGNLYLDFAVQSVLNQTYQNWELFLIDDGSKDDSYEKAVKWSEKDKRIIALHHPDHANKGVSATRNLGIHHAKGEYIALLDCDDEWLPEKLEKQIKIIRLYPETVMIYCQAETIDETGMSLRLNPEKADKCPIPPIYGSGFPGEPLYIFEQVINITEVQPCCSTVLAKTDTVRNFGGFDETFKYQMEDAFFFALLAERGAIFFIEEILAKYRFHNESWSANLDRYKKIAITNLEYADKLIKGVKSENRPLCSKELVNRWSRFVLGPSYWSSEIKIDIPHIMSTFFMVLRHRDVLLKDKARSVWILTRWIGWKFFLSPFMRK